MGSCLSRCLEGMLGSNNSTSPRSSTSSGRTHKHTRNINPHTSTAIPTEENDGIGGVVALFSEDEEEEESCEGAVRDGTDDDQQGHSVASLFSGSLRYHCPPPAGAVADEETSRELTSIGVPSVGTRDCLTGEALMALVLSWSSAEFLQREVVDPSAAPDT
jgi:hypothetical protein